MALPPIQVKVVGDTADLTRSFGQVAKDVGGFGKSLAAITVPGGKAVAVTKKLAGVTADVAKAGAEATNSERQFAEALDRVIPGVGDYAAVTDEAILASQKLAFTDDETRAAIVTLATATGDATEAVDLLSGAQDLARHAGVSLEQAADALAKAYAGQDTALTRMLPGMENYENSHDTLQAALRLSSGAADTFAESGAGASAKVDIAMSELKETVGQELTGAFKDLWVAFQPLLKQFLELASKILPPLLNLLEKLFNVAGKVAGAINKIVDAVSKLIKKIKELLGPLTDAVNKLKQIDLNPFKSAGKSAAAATAGISQFGTSQANAPGRGAVTINIYGDPAVIEARVVHALRKYQTRNGVGSILTPGRI